MPSVIAIALAGIGFAWLLARNWRWENRRPNRGDVLADIKSICFGLAIGYVMFHIFIFPLAAK